VSQPASDTPAGSFTAYHLGRLIHMLAGSLVQAAGSSSSATRTPSGAGGTVSGATATTPASAAPLTGVPNASVSAWGPLGGLGLWAPQAPGFATGLPAPLTLTKDQVTQLQQAVDTFAQNYTSGANATQDQGAWKALQSSLQDLVANTSGTPNTSSSPPGSTNPPSPAPGVPAVTLPKDEVAQWKQAVDTFAQNYTSGANATQDQSAWSAFDSSLTSIAQDVAANQFAASHVLNKDQVTQLQQAVNTFAQNYTNGTNLSQDASAYKALQTSLKGVLTSVSGPPVLPALGLGRGASSAPGVPGPIAI
jgi:hypothetical protein